MNNDIDYIAKKKELGQGAVGSPAPANNKADGLNQHNPITNPLAYVNQNPYVNK